MNNGKLTGAVYVDLSKAFDTIGHSVLLQKLSTYGVKDKELEWFNSYLFNRKNYVCVDINISSPESVYCGVSQGSVLGPLLFNFYQRPERLHQACTSYYVCSRYSNVSFPRKQRQNWKLFESRYAKPVILLL